MEKENSIYTPEIDDKIVEMHAKFNQNQRPTPEQSKAVLDFTGLLDYYKDLKNYSNAFEWLTGENRETKIKECLLMGDTNGLTIRTKTLVESIVDHAEEWVTDELETIEDKILNFKYQPTK